MNQKRRNRTNEIIRQARKQRVIGYDFSPLIGDPLEGFGSKGVVVRGGNFSGEPEVASYVAAILQSPAYIASANQSVDTMVGFTLKPKNPFQTQDAYNAYAADVVNAAKRVFATKLIDQAKTYIANIPSNTNSMSLTMIRQTNPMLGAEIDRQLALKGQVDLAAQAKYYVDNPSQYSGRDVFGNPLPTALVAEINRQFAAIAKAKLEATALDYVNNPSKPRITLTGQPLPVDLLNEIARQEAIIAQKLLEAQALSVIARPGGYNGLDDLGRPLSPALIAEVNRQLALKAGTLNSAYQNRLIAHGFSPFMVNPPTDADMDKMDAAALQSSDMVHVASLARDLTPIDVKQFREAMGRAGVDPIYDDQIEADACRVWKDEQERIALEREDAWNLELKDRIEHPERHVFKSNSFWSVVTRAIGQAMTAVVSFPTAIVKAIPIVKDIYAGVDHVTGGALTSIENISTIPGRVVAGETITGKELLDDLSFAAKLGAIVVTGGAAAAVIGASAQQLKLGPLGDTALGRTLLDVASIAAVAGAAVSTAQGAAAKAAEAGASASEQAATQATAQVAADAGAAVGNTVANASVSSAIQNALIDKGQEMAKDALVAEVAKKTGVVGAIIAGSATGGIDFSSGAVVPSGFSIDKAVEAGKTSIVTTAENKAAEAIGLPTNIISTAKGIVSGDLSVTEAASKAVNTAVNNAIDAIKNDPFGAAQKLLALATAKKDRSDIIVASQAAELSANNVQTYKEASGTVKNIVTGQVYPTVQASFYSAKVTDEQFKALELSPSEIQANLSNNARRLNVMIARFPNSKLTKEKRAANKLKIESELAPKVAKANVKAIAAADEFVTSQDEVRELIVKGNKAKADLESNQNLAIKDQLVKNVNDINLALIKATNRTNEIKAKALTVLTQTSLIKAQAALKVAAAEEGRYWPGMFDTAHPMLVYGIMERTV